MRTPPLERTWGTGEFEIVIRQSRPITVDELFEHFPWRGLELFDGWVMPKGAGLSHEERAQDEQLCVAMEEKLLPFFSRRADDLASQSAKSHDVGFLVSRANTTYNDALERLDAWFAQQYHEVWIVSPWYQHVDIYTAPRQYKTYRGADILPGFELPVAQIFED